MRKSTLVKGGSAALLCVMAFYGLSPVLNAAGEDYTNIPHTVICGPPIFSS